MQRPLLVVWTPMVGLSLELFRMGLVCLWLDIFPCPFVLFLFVSFSFLPPFLVLVPVGFPFLFLFGCFGFHLMQLCGECQELLLRLVLMHPRVFFDEFIIFLFRELHKLKRGDCYRSVIMGIDLGANIRLERLVWHQLIGLGQVSEEILSFFSIRCEFLNVSIEFSSSFFS